MNINHFYKRNTDNYDSDYESSEPVTTSHTPSYLRSSYLYSKPTNIDDYSLSPLKSSSVTSWRNRFKNLDTDDDDILLQPRYSKYTPSSCKFFKLIVLNE